MNDIPVFDPDTLSHVPVRDLLDLLIEHEDRVPRILFDACVARGEDMVAALADFYARPDADDERDVWWMGLHALFLLGAIPGEAAGRLLIDALRRADREDELLLDWVAGGTAWLFANKPPATIDLARELVQDRSTSWSVRYEVVDAVVAAGLTAGPTELDAALDWLAGLVAGTSDDPNFRLLAASNLLDFPRQRHRALLDEMAAEQETAALFNCAFVSDDVAHSFADAKDAPGWKRRGEPWTFYDEAEILARQERWREEEDARAPSVADRHDGLYDFPEPYVREQPKPGRNDPCPCGSGMKYKKCCLPADEAREALTRQLH